MSEADVKKKGVTLYFKKSSNTMLQTGKKVAELTLRAEIEDDGVWGSVVQNFHQGFHVSTIGSFKDEMIGVLRDELQVVERKNLELEDEIRRLKGLNQVLGSQNRSLMEGSLGK